MSETTATVFNRDPGAVKRAALDGPVVVTEHGRPSLVVMTWDHHQRLIGRDVPLTRLLAHPASADIELDLPRRVDVPRNVEL